jgi:MoaA/NifB/PqqE/SkfB family radical SAM enzyme
MSSDVLAEVSREFLTHPKAVIDGFIAARGLKGNILSRIQQTLIEHAARPELQPFLWLLFTPIVASVILTEGRCNLACRMCGGSKGTLRALTPDSLRIILRHIPSVELVIFVAGNSEPLLHPDLPEILQVLKEFRVNADIVTNGHLLTPSLVTTMLDTQRPTSLNISLDAATPATYESIRHASFNHVVSNLRQLRDERARRALPWPRRALLMVGMADNIADLPAMVDLAAELDAFRVHVDHLKGEHTPGDFTTCPDWQVHVMEAMRRAKATGVLLQLPTDVKVALPRLAAPAPTQRSVTGTAPRVPSFTQCSWSSSVYIGLDGTMTPCCHHLKRIGNIFAAPIWEQRQYLLYRMNNSRGQVEPFCIQARNCAYTEEQRALGLRPPQMKPEAA